MADSAVVAALAFAVPAAISAGQAVFPDAPATLLVEPDDDNCMVRWYVPDTDTDGTQRTILTSTVAPEQMSAWRRDGRVAAAGQLQAAVSMHGNAGSAVEIRDISIAVTQREELAPDKVTALPGGQNQSLRLPLPSNDYLVGRQEDPSQYRLGERRQGPQSGPDRG